MAALRKVQLEDHVRRGFRGHRDCYSTNHRAILVYLRNVEENRVEITHVFLRYLFV